MKTYERPKTQDGMIRASRLLQQQNGKESQMRFIKLPLPPTSLTVTCRTTTPRQPYTVLKRISFSRRIVPDSVSSEVERKRFRFSRERRVFSVRQCGRRFFIIIIVIIVLKSLCAYPPSEGKDNNMICLQHRNVTNYCHHHGRSRECFPYGPAADDEYSKCRFEKL